MAEVGLAMKKRTPYTFAEMCRLCKIDKAGEEKFQRLLDENKCIGCGICTTKCEFDAITLHRDRPECTTMVTAEDKFKAIIPYQFKRAAKIVTRKKN
jgi:ferredoxin